MRHPVRLFDERARHAIVAQGKNPRVGAKPSSDRCLFIRRRDDADGFRIAKKIFELGKRIGGIERQVDSAHPHAGERKK